MRIGFTFAPGIISLIIFVLTWTPQQAQVSCYSVRGEGILPGVTWREDVNMHGYVEGWEQGVYGGLGGTEELWDSGYRVKQHSW